MTQSHHLRAIIFDLDDTLIDWSGQSMLWEDYLVPRCTAVYEHLAAAGYTFPITPLELTQLVHTISVNEWQIAKQTWHGASLRVVWHKVLLELGLAPEQFDVESLLQIHGWGPFPGVTLFADTLPVLNSLRQQGYQLGLITNSYHPMWMRDIELRHFGLSDYFPVRLCSGDVGYMKPHPAIFWHLLDQLQIPPAQAMYVGDRPINDVAGANSAGMISVWLNLPHLQRDLEGIQPHYTIRQLPELLPLVHRLECGTQAFPDVQPDVRQSLTNNGTS